MTRRPTGGRRMGAPPSPQRPDGGGSAARAMAFLTRETSKRGRGAGYVRIEVRLNDARVG